MLIKGKWWSYEKIQNLVAPNKEVPERVIAYLATLGITQVVNLRDSIKVTTSVSDVEDLLHTTLYNFMHRTGLKEGEGRCSEK